MFKTLRSGVWKDTEDQILKAAVMKYGLNQWDRISSLLINKTARQCKSRWIFWLNPKLKKSQWSFEEDERLIYLSYIFPSQWSTIAPYLNRTPEQCVERFDKLVNLKAVYVKEKDYIIDPRYTTYKDYNINLDTKPPVKNNITEDYEMQNILVEARARLANTKGKKAMRKAKSIANYFSNFVQTEKISHFRKYIFSENISSKSYNFSIYNYNSLRVFNAPIGKYFLKKSINITNISACKKDLKLSNHNLMLSKYLNNCNYFKPRNLLVCNPYSNFFQTFNYYNKRSQHNYIANLYLNYTTVRNIFSKSRKNYQEKNTSENIEEKDIFNLKVA
mmetsp:Transcript_18332/g.25489  ORF Transcript_18332/g.25489 Transcript_18332/m.25489 type:complete len:332 (-) Transcript_18332:12-1007(-)